MFDSMYNICSAMVGHYGYEFDRKMYIIMQRFLNLYMKRFKYSGFSDNFLERYGNRSLWELFLFFAPAVAWLKDGTGELICLPVSGEWKYNAVGKPTSWRVWAINGSFSKELTEKDSVLMFNDEAMSIPYIQLSYEARYMRKLDMAMEQNINLQSTPYVIEAFDENVNSANNWVKLVNNFASRIVIRGRRDKNEQQRLQSQVLKTDVPLQIKDLMTAYNEFNFRALSYLGFKNVNIEKSERLLTGEISANDMTLQDNYTNALDMRKLAIEEVNRKLNVNIKVEPMELESLLPDLRASNPMLTQPYFNNGGDSNANKTTATE